MWKRIRPVFGTTRWVAACLLLVVAARGCGRDDHGGESASAPGPGESAPAAARYPDTLSEESSPTQVAQVLVRALDEGDEETLLGLVAVEHETAEVDAIYRKYGRRSSHRPGNVAAMTAAGWRATYAFFKENETRVSRETIEGHTAVVFASGKSPVGKPRTLKITLLREDGLWKVRAGLESLPE